MDFVAKFDRGLPYRAFLEHHGTEEQRRRWETVREQVQLTEAQKGLLRSFAREMHVLVLAGAWCGDCVNECPIFDRIASENDRIQIRYFDRDEHPDLADGLSICGGKRVPVVVFLSEDGYECGRYGDRTLSRYRQLVGKLTGAACPSGLVAPERTDLESVVQEWLNEFERIQHMLRTSSRLRQIHGD